MSCAPADIACEIAELADEVARLADAQGGFDLGAFVTTLLATLVGAGAAFATSLLIAKRDRQDRRDVSLVDHVERLALAMDTWADEHRQYLRDRMLPITAAELRGVTYGAPRRAPEPERTELDVALDMLIARSTGADREVALAVRRLVYEQTFVDNSDWVGPETAAIRRTLVAWASRLWTTTQVHAALGDFFARVDAKQKDRTAKRDDIEPRVPEPYPARVATDRPATAA